MPEFGVINIHRHDVPIEVCYKAIRDTVSTLLFPQGPLNPTLQDSDVVCDLTNHSRTTTTITKATPAFDLVLNIGMAAKNQFYSLETCARRDGYVRKDVRGETMGNDLLWKDTYHAPETLEPTFDTVDISRRWKTSLPDEDLRSSSDAGNFCCDFIYYTSMVEYWRRDMHGQRPCMFLHVPGGHTDADLARGRQVALNLIAAFVSSQIVQDWAPTRETVTA